MNCHVISIKPVLQKQPVNIIPFSLFLILQKVCQSTHTNMAVNAYTQHVNHIKHETNLLNVKKYTLDSILHTSATESHIL